jgi:hypothetical protein
VTDTKDHRALGLAQIDMGNKNSATNCINECDKRGFAMAGVEGVQCFCGNKVGTANGQGQVRPMSECEAVKCGAVATSTCGGDLRLKTFKNTKPSSGGGSSGGNPSGGSTGTGKKGKKGLAWANGDDGHLHYYVAPGVNLLYTWSAYCPNDAEKYGITCMPMLWGGEKSKIDTFKKKVKAGDKWKIIMAFNEPNEPGQSNMTPQQACKVYREVITPLRNSGKKVVSPATTCGPDGLEWMKKFRSVCPDAKWDHLALHWYNTNMNDFKARLNAYHKEFPNDNIWVTEFANQNWHGAQKSQSEVNQFYHDAMQFLEDTPWIDAYFPFGLFRDMQGVNKNCQLMKSDGSPTPLGSQFLHG